MTVTSLAHGGGCGCKLAPSVLRELLAGQPLVGAEVAQHAAGWQVDNQIMAISAAPPPPMPFLTSLQWAIIRSARPK